MLLLERERDEEIESVKKIGFFTKRVSRREWKRGDRFVGEDSRGLEGRDGRACWLAFASAGRNDFASPKNTFAPLISFAARSYLASSALLLSNRESHS